MSAPSSKRYFAYSVSPSCTAECNGLIVVIFSVGSHPGNEKGKLIKNLLIFRNMALTHWTYFGFFNNS